MNTEHWYVLVEEQVGYRTGIRWQLTETIPAKDMEHALEIARYAAYRHMPANPHLPQHRSLFRAPDGSWLVNVHGATATFHFRVSVAEYYGTFAGTNPA